MTEDYNLYSITYRKAMEIINNNNLKNMSQDSSPKKHFNLFVIGGGSGGISCARQAALFGKKVGLADYVKPSPLGTKWGLGGTCINVGCIPKKLMHYSSLIGQNFKQLPNTGWKIKNNNIVHVWETLLQKISNHIKSLNFQYRKSLTSQKIQYFNKLAKFLTPNTLQLTSQDGSKQLITADKILIATGGRPLYPQIPGAKQHSITSDDLFWKQKSPGKTLIVGASYIALECAGFLHGMGLDVTVMVRSIFLRGFDQQLANKVADYMQKHGVKFIKNAVPISIKLNKGKKQVTYKKSQQTCSDTFDTILFAIGRYADTKGLALEKIGIKTSKNGKIVCNDDDTTSVPDIYAIGDVVEGRLQLTPTAILAGKLLARRLFGQSQQLMNYKFVPTTVFTPLEYGCCGYSQQDATKQFGEQHIIAYGSKFKPLQWSLTYQKGPDCYAKLIINKAQNNRVIGFHFLGPNAGQVTQGFALAIRKGMTKQDFDFTVGIHPTCAEQFTLLQAIAGSSNQTKSGC